MKRISAACLLLFLAPALQAEELKTLHQKTLYAIGLSLGEEARGYELKPEERVYVTMGLEDALKGKAQMELSAMRPKLALLKQERWHHPFLDAAKVQGVKKPSGLIYQEIRKGSRPSPSSSADRVRAHYHGTFTDGKVFDSSVTRGEPFVAPLNRVIKCWTEGIQLMHAGGKARLTCPAEIAYGAQGRGGIPGGATLIFDVELLAVNP
ncbi:MAG: FKBP-type peptidyl-prolyl cis-trans isomerase [Elusimicrobiota bacterium]